MHKIQPLNFVVASIFLKFLSVRKHCFHCCLLTCQQAEPVFSSSVQFSLPQRKRKWSLRYLCLVLDEVICTAIYLHFVIWQFFGNFLPSHFPCFTPGLSVVAPLTSLDSFHTHCDPDGYCKSHFIWKLPRRFRSAFYCLRELLLDFNGVGWL